MAPPRRLHHQLRVMFPARLSLPARYRTSKPILVLQCPDNPPSSNAHLVSRPHRRQTVNVHSGLVVDDHHLFLARICCDAGLPIVTKKTVQSRAYPRQIFISNHSASASANYAHRRPRYSQNFPQRAPKQRPVRAARDRAIATRPETDAGQGETAENTAAKKTRYELMLGLKYLKHAVSVCIRPM